jgi:hypothetical protein
LIILTLQGPILFNKTSVQINDLNKPSLSIPVGKKEPTSPEQSNPLQTSGKRDTLLTVTQSIYDRVNGLGYSKASD